MKQFVLMIKEGTPDDVPLRTPEEMQETYLAWMEQMIEKKAYKTGSRLSKNQWDIGLDGRVGNDGPFVESKELIGGIVIFAARDHEEALNIVKLSPFYGYHPLVLREANQMYEVP